MYYHGHSKYEETAFTKFFPAAAAIHNVSGFDSRFRIILAAWC